MKWGKRYKTVNDQHRNDKEVKVVRKHITYVLILLLLLCGCQNKESIDHKETAKIENKQEIDEKNEGEKQTSNEQKQAEDNNQQDNTDTKEQGMETPNTDGFMITIDGQEFHVITEDHETVDALMEQFPMTLTMDDLHGNEKYYYLDQSLPTSIENVRTIQAGDIMLFQDDCLVLFYESFSTTYSYTRIGHVENVDQFVQVVGSGSIQATFQK